MLLLGLFLRLRRSRLAACPRFLLSATGLAITVMTAAVCHHWPIPFAHDFRLHCDAYTLP